MSFLSYSNWRLSAGSGAAVVAWWATQTWLVHSAGVTWQTSALDAFVCTVCLTLACFITTIIYSYYQPGRSNRLHRLLFAVIIAITAAVACRRLLGWMIEDQGYQVFLERSMPVRYVIGFIAVAFVTVMNWLLGSLRAQQAEIARRNETEALMKEAELAGLREQLQPHFIFNSLNSISALINVQPAEAQSMVEKLSDFLRGTLRKETRQMITLSEELRHLSLYLDIEKIRFGHRLKVVINAPEEVMDAKLPALLLQPVVENAIKFGLYGTTGEVEIVVEAGRVDGAVSISVRNPYDAVSSRATKGTGFGLSAIKRRLSLLYGRQDLLTAAPEGELFVTTIVIPQS